MHLHNTNVVHKLPWILWIGTFRSVCSRNWPHTQSVQIWMLGSSQCVQQLLRTRYNPMLMHGWIQDYRIHFAESTQAWYVTNIPTPFIDLLPSYKNKYTSFHRTVQQLIPQTISRIFFKHEEWNLKLQQNEVKCLEPPCTATCNNIDYCPTCHRVLYAFV